MVSQLPIESRINRQLAGRFAVALLGVIFVLQAGCSATRQLATQRAATIASLGNRPIVDLKPAKRRGGGNRLLNRFAKKSRPPSPRAQLLLRKYDLLTRYEQDPDAVLGFLTELSHNGPTIQEIYTLSEIAEIQADRSLELGDTQRATRLYATAVLHAYQFLFDPSNDNDCNAYDPQFRSICDIYNRSLEGLLREVCANGQLQPGHTIKLGNAQQGIEFEVRLQGRWQNEQFERFELVNDYETSGLDNHYHTFGLGVPLIAIRQQHENSRVPQEKYYPPDLTLPMTAFMSLSPGELESLHVDNSIHGPSFNVHRAVLSLYDPLERTQVVTESKIVPLESDITTPLAYGLKNPLVNRGVYATASLLNADFAPDSYGMYMLEPYDPTKIPVVMVHGLWSSPVTWAHMFNDLRANRDIRENCQFWFYSYPTGQPFWISAQQMRTDLANIKRELDPRGDSRSLDQMVLVGHSMGGLVSLMQTMESGDHFWNTISDESINSLVGDRRTIDLLRETFYFDPNPSIERVITIATPRKGSEFANSATRWVGQKLITLPTVVTQDINTLAKQNQDKLKGSSLLTRATSIDSLAIDDPVFGALEVAQQSARVKSHNIVGRLPASLLRKLSGTTSTATGDGIVSCQSAHCNTAKSQVFVPAEHAKVHQHPGCIYEVQRILLEHLGEHDRVRVREIPQLPTVRQATNLEPLIDDPSQGRFFGRDSAQSNDQSEEKAKKASRIGWSTNPQK